MEQEGWRVQEGTAELPGQTGAMAFSAVRGPWLAQFQVVDGGDIDTLVFGPASCSVVLTLELIKVS